MLNPILHALSNRSGPFEDPTWISDPAFRAATLPEADLNLRKHLGLHLQQDYYISVYLACLQAYPDIEELLPEGLVTGGAKVQAPGGVRVTGAKFNASETFPSGFVDQPVTRWPMDLNYCLRFVDGSTVQVLMPDTSRSQMLAYRLVTQPTRQLLYPAWNDMTPFQGGLDLQQTWADGAAVDLETRPSQFPVQLVINKVKTDTYLLAGLRANKLVDEFVATRDVYRQLALTLAVLVLGHPMFTS